MATDTRRATIALVGIDGAGKTTQAHRLTEYLNIHGHQAKYHMPANGRRALGNAARRFGRTDSVALLGPKWAIRTETLLRQANLAVSGPQTVVSDRYDICQYARARMVCPELEPWVRHRLRRVPRADLVLFLDVAPETALRRVTERGTDEESLDGLTSLNRAYRSLPEAEWFTYVDAHGDVDEISDSIITVVRSRLPELFDDQA